MPFALINGQFIDEQQAALSIADLTIQRGYGVFDFFRLKNGQPLFLDLHLGRLANSCRQMHLQLDHREGEIREWIDAFIERNGLLNEGIRITVTGGRSTAALFPGTPSIILQTQPFEPVTADQFEQGFHLQLYEYRRTLPGIKSIDYLMAVWLRPWLKERAADEVLYYSGEEVLECPRANVFMVDGKQSLCTPAEGILKGVTRHHLLDLGRSFTAVEERAILRSELLSASEVFICSTTKQVLPVTRIDGRTIGNGGPGTLTRELAASYGNLL